MQPGKKPTALKMKRKALLCLRRQTAAAEKQQTTADTAKGPRHRQVAIANPGFLQITNTQNRPPACGIRDRPRTRPSTVTRFPKQGFATCQTQLGETSAFFSRHESSVSRYAASRTHARI